MMGIFVTIAVTICDNAKNLMKFQKIPDSSESGIFLILVGDAAAGSLLAVFFNEGFLLFFRFNDDFLNRVNCTSSSSNS